MSILDRGSFAIVTTGATNEMYEFRRVSAKHNCLRISITICAQLSEIRISTSKHK